MQVMVDSLLTHYEQAGEGKMVVLLHGWGDNLQTFDELSRTLSKKFRILRVDLPGFGQTQMPNGVWGLADYAQFVANWLHKLKAGHVYAFVGHSNGGAVVIKGLANDILYTDRVILLAAAGLRGGGGVKRLALKVAAKAGKPFLYALPKSKRQAARRRFYGTIGSDLLVAEHLQETFKKTVREDVQNDARKVKRPALLVWGEQDKAVPLADGVRLSQLLPNADLKIIHGAEHFVHHDQPARVADLIEEFLK